MKRLFAVALALLLALWLAVPAFAAGGYTITNPYRAVDWDAWDAYKANLHVHTTFSDGNMDLADVVDEYYAQGYDALAIADHGVVQAAWDKWPRTMPPLDIPHWFSNRQVLTSARLAEITAGSDRGNRGMVQVPLGIELNAATVYKNHLVGLYGGWGWYWTGLGIDYRIPVAMTQRRGGITFLAHPGDWAKDVNDKDMLNFHADIFRDYPSLLGMEVYNRIDTSTRHDRVLWDNLLARLMPEGRNVFGFANDDSHTLTDIGCTATLLYMPSNTAQNVRKCLESGAFLACSRRDRAVLGDQFVGDYDEPFPSIERITILGDVITIDAADTTAIEWIADGNVILSGSDSIDLAAYADQITCYVRAQLIGPGGISATQAFGVDKGDGYRFPSDARKGFDKFWWTFELMARRSVFMFLYETVAKLFK